MGAVRRDLQLISEECVSVLRRCQFLECRLRRLRGLLVDVIWRDFRRGVLFRAIVELSVELSAVEIIEEFLQFPRNVHVFYIVKEIHVPEWIDGNQREVRLGLSQVMQRMGKAFSIGHQEVDIFWLKKKLQIENFWDFSLQNGRNEKIRRFVASINKWRKVILKYS